MLNRLKQSIASAKVRLLGGHSTSRSVSLARRSVPANPPRGEKKKTQEFAQFLKKRSMLEDEHANALKKLCRLSQENMQRGEHRGGTFAKAYEEMMAVQERMAENGLQFAMSLHQMADDLNELALIAEKSRKGWKQSGLAAEQRVADLEAAMRKSKAKYDALAEEYDRIRTGDTSGRQGGKMFGFKGHKLGAQHEEDALRKAQAADQDYQAKVQIAAAERSELETKTRPETVQALQDAVRECDSGLALQMQKFGMLAPRNAARPRDEADRGRWQLRSTRSWCSATASTLALSRTGPTPGACASPCFPSTTRRTWTTI